MSRRANSALAPLTGGSGGELLPLVIRFYLSDGTFEISEMRTDGKDPFPRLLHRNRLPRALPPVGERASAEARCRFWGATAASC
jgi:hypothetical protein